MQFNPSSIHSAENTLIKVINDLLGTAGFYILIKLYY